MGPVASVIWFIFIKSVLRVHFLLVASGPYGVQVKVTENHAGRHNSSDPYLNACMINTFYDGNMIKKEGWKKYTMHDLQDPKRTLVTCIS